MSHVSYRSAPTAISGEATRAWSEDWFLNHDFHPFSFPEMENGSGRGEG